VTYGVRDVGKRFQRQMSAVRVKHRPRGENENENENGSKTGQFLILSY
jgi:hypothetical protein